MHICMQCHTQATEPDAMFCYKCGKRLPEHPSASSADGSYWCIYDYFNGRWSMPFGYGAASAKEALAQANSPSWLAMFRGEPGSGLSPLSPMRLGRVRSAPGDLPNVYEVLEWIKVVWSESRGGEWVIGEPASDPPDRNRLIVSTLESST